MKHNTLSTLNDAELELVSGGRTSPSATSRDGGQPDGDVQQNDQAAAGVGDPQSIF